MFRSISKPLATAGASVVLASLALAQAKVGDTPSFTFSSELVNGQGVKSLADLRGRPVLVDFWGTNCPPCIGFAVPSAVKLAEEYGDDLVVLFVECQGSTPDKMEGFALKNRWLGRGTAMWTTERVFDLGFDGIPHSALLSPEGEIVLAGMTGDIHGQIEEQVELLVERAKDAPEDTPKELKKSWKAFAKGDYGKALAEARAVGENPALKAASDATVATFIARIEGRIARAEWMAEQGDSAVALGQLERLGKDLAGEEQVSARVTELTKKLAGNTTELDASRELDRVEEKLYGEGPDEKSYKALRKIAERYADTRAGARAARLAELAKTA